MKSFVSPEDIRAVNVNLIKKNKIVGQQFKTTAKGQKWDSNLFKSENEHDTWCKADPIVSQKQFQTILYQGQVLL